MKGGPCEEAVGSRAEGGAAEWPQRGGGGRGAAPTAPSPTITSPFPAPSSGHQLWMEAENEGTERGRYAQPVGLKIGK